MKDKIQKINSELELLKQEFKNFISDRNISLKDRVLLFVESPDYMKERENMYNFGQKCPMTKEYIKTCPVERYELFDVGYELGDHVLYVLEKLETEGRDYSNITKEEFNFIFNNEEQESGNYVTYDSFNKTISLIEEIMKNNISFIIIDW